MHLLITRPARQALETKARLEQQGHTCILDPLLRVESLLNQLPNMVFDGIILTSANAVEALNKHWRENNRPTVPVFTTGETTARLARKAGFENCIPVQGSARNLTSFLLSWLGENPPGPGGRFLYPCSKIKAWDIGQLLAPHGIHCTNWPVYQTIETTDLSTSTKQALVKGTLDGVLLYSARTARNFASLLPNKTDCPALFVLSEEIKMALPPHLRQHAKVPSETSENAVLLLLQAQKE